jgi:hypothetical protein
MMSIGPVANAFLIMLLVIAIYSILAVEFFSEWVGPEPEFFPVGDFFFGTFSKSMFSLFQVRILNPRSLLLLLFLSKP